MIVLLAFLVCISGYAFAFVVWKAGKVDEAQKKMFEEDEACSKYMIANRVFSRDPESFKDKDEDGVEDILE
jgi:hypothetical protein